MRYSLWLVAILLGSSWTWQNIATWQWFGRDSTNQLTSPSSSQTEIISESGVDSSLDDPLVPPIDAQGMETRRGLGFEFDHDERATFHAHGQKTCASGCAASRHPTKRLSRGHYRRLLRECSSAPMDRFNLAYETLLYFGRQTLVLLDQYGTDPLSATQHQQLASELKRSHALVSIRVVDDRGTTRSWTNDVRVPLDRRHVFEMETNQVQPLITSGTVKRVGQDHLWTRL